MKAQLLLSLILLQLVACAHTPSTRTVEQARLAEAAPATAPTGIVQNVIGQVQIQSAADGKITPVAKGQKISVSDTLVTSSGGRAKLVMPDQNEFDLAPDSKMTLQIYENSPAKKAALLNLIKGKIRAKVREKYDGNANRFLIKTPASVSGVRGTDFAMSFDEEGGLSKIVTFEGAVDFGLPGPEDTIVSAVTVEQGQISKAMPDIPPTAPKTLSHEELEKSAREFAIEDSVGAKTLGVDPATAARWLRNGNIRFVKNRLRADGQRKKDVLRLTKQQRPHSVVITSSDSRIPPEIVFDQKLGEIFVIRTLNLDQSAVGAAEYAVAQLGVRFVLILGLSGEPTPGPWADPKTLVTNLEGRSAVLKSAAESGLVIQSAVYDLKTGLVHF